MPKEQFFYRENEPHLKLLDEAARRSGVSRGQAFEDFLEMAVCVLSGGAMEEQYLAVVKKHASGTRGKRGVDALSELFGRLVSAMEQTRDNMRDVLGDLFVGGISYGEAGQFFSPEPICRMMAKLTVGDISEELQHSKRFVSDPCCGSGRMLLAVAELQRHWVFVGHDIDLRCVRMTGINMALRDLYGYVIWGNSLKDERRLVYRTGFNLRGFIREMKLDECPMPVQEAALGDTQTPTSLQSSVEPSVAETIAPPTDGSQKSVTQLRLFDD